MPTSSLRRHARRATTTVCALALLAGSHISAHAQPCTPNVLTFRSFGSFAVSSAQFDTTLAGYGDRLAYDLVTGLLELSTCCTFAPTVLETFDAYDVVGVPPGTPVQVTVELASRGEIYDAGGCGGSGCGGTYAASIRNEAEVVEDAAAFTLYAGARAPFQFTISLPLTIVAGKPEEIRFRLQAQRAPGGSHGEIGESRFRFAVSDARASVVSCYGHVGTAVPSRPTSWGGLKATYR